MSYDRKCFCNAFSWPTWEGSIAHLRVGTHSSSSLWYRPKVCYTHLTYLRVLRIRCPSQARQTPIARKTSSSFSSSLSSNDHRPPRSRHHNHRNSLGSEIRRNNDNYFIRLRLRTSRSAVRKEVAAEVITVWFQQGYKHVQKPIFDFKKRKLETSFGVAPLATGDVIADNLAYCSTALTLLGFSP